MAGRNKRWAWWDAAHSPQNRGPVGVAIIVLMIAIVAIFGFGSVRDAWTGRWDAILGITTVVLAGLIFVMGMNTRWTQSLPLRLTVDYKLVKPDGRTEILMIVFDVPLAGVADIRGFSQQIASQMASRMGVPVPENRYVPFKPFNEIGQSQRVYDSEQGWFVRHRATFYIDFLRPTSDLNKFWALTDDGLLRWGPNARTAVGAPGVLLWWNNLADQPSNDVAWICGAHSGSALVGIADLASAEVNLYLQKLADGGLQLCDDSEMSSDSAPSPSSDTSKASVIDPAVETLGKLPCGCTWDLTYSRARAEGIA